MDSGYTWFSGSVPKTRNYRSVGHGHSLPVSWRTVFVLRFLTMKAGKYLSASLMLPSQNKIAPLA